MRLKHSIFLLVLLVSTGIKAKSQTPPPPQTRPVLMTGANSSGGPQYYSTGEIAGSLGEAKAINLVKPVYPDKGKESGAEGKVRVDLVIDKGGTVKSATAVAGDPILFEAAEYAAKRSTFLTSRIVNKAESYPAYLIYEFLIAKPNWFKVGYDVASAEKMPVLYYLETALLQKAFEPDWDSERELVRKLQEIKSRTPKPPLPVLFDQKTETLVSPNRTDQRGSARLYVPEPNFEHVSIAQNLISQLRGRLGNNEQDLWRFDLGIEMIKFHENYRNPDRRLDAFGLIKAMIQRAPKNTAPEFLAEVQNFLSASWQKRTIESDDSIRQAIINLQKF